MRFKIFPGVATVAFTLALLGCAASSTQDVATQEGVTRDFLTMTTDGAEVSGESLRGQVTIVDFWAVF